MRKSKAPSQIGLKRTAASFQARPIKKEVTEDVVRRFEVMYGRISTRTTQKTYSSDGILELSENTLILRDDDGEIECTAFYQKNMKLREGSEIIMEPKEVKIVRELTREVDEPSTARCQQRSPSPTYPDQEFQMPRMDVFVKQERLSPTPSPSHLPIKEESSPKRVKIEVDALPENSSDSDSYSPPPSPNGLAARPTNDEGVAPEPDEDPPLDDAEIIIMCTPTSQQLITFHDIQKDFDAKNGSVDPREHLECLQYFCNGPIQPNSPDKDHPAKWLVLRALIESAISRKQCILVIAQSPQVMGEILHYCCVIWRHMASVILEDEQDMIEIGTNTDSKIMITTPRLLDLIKTYELVVHVTVAYESLTEGDDKRGRALMEDVTRGPVYHLITAGGIEERLFQTKFLIPNGDLDGRSSKQLLESGVNSNTHDLMDCDCFTRTKYGNYSAYLQESSSDDELSTYERHLKFKQKKQKRLEAKKKPLAGWYHTPGGIDSIDVIRRLNLGRCAGTVAFLFTRPREPL